MTEAYKLDCSGLVCPLPVAKTKKILANMEKGNILEISGDFCEAGENIIRYVTQNGGKVIESHIEGDAYFLKIEKL